MTWQLVYTKQAQKDAKKLSSSGLKEKANDLLDIVAANPYQNPPPYENWSATFPAHIQGVLTFNTGWCIKFLKNKKQ